MNNSSANKNNVEVGINEHISFPLSDAVDAKELNKFLPHDEPKVDPAKDEDWIYDVEIDEDDNMDEPQGSVEHVLSDQVQEVAKQNVQANDDSDAPDGTNQDDDTKEHTSCIKDIPSPPLDEILKSLQEDSMIIYNDEEDPAKPLRIGKVLAVDPDKNICEVHIYDSYFKGRNKEDCQEAQFAPVWIDPKDGKEFYEEKPKRKVFPQTDYVKPGEIVYHNFYLTRRNRVPTSAAWESQLFC